MCQCEVESQLKSCAGTRPRHTAAQTDTQTRTQEHTLTPASSVDAASVVAANLFRLSRREALHTGAALRESTEHSRMEKDECELCIGCCVG